MRISDYVMAVAARAPDSTAFIDGDLRVSYREATQSALKICAMLRGLAKEEGPLHVAILSPNDHRICILQIAINFADHVWVSLHSRNSTSAQIATLRELECDVLFYHSSFEPVVEEINRALPDGIAYICIDQPGSLGPSLQAWAADATEATLAPQERPLDLMMLQPTGGTTGPSKGVVHTHRSMETCVRSVVRTYVIDENSVYLAVAPLTHAGGFFALAFLCAGSCVVVQKEFNPAAVFQAISELSVSHLFLPPTAVYALLNEAPAASADFSSLRSLIVGAAPIAPQKFKEAVRIFGPVMYELYGQTECLGPVLSKGPSDYLLDDGSFDENVLSSTGRPGDSVWVAIMDDDGNLLPNGESGEIVVRTSMVMQGYYKRPEETAEVSTHGWHHTTDVGSMDERGYVTIRDRKKDMIISGGFNIYPSEIEAVILKHPSVLVCAVIGVPDEKWGEAVKAVIELKPGESEAPDEIIALCKAELGSLKAPKSVEFWPSLPRSAVGKLLKKDIRARYWADEWRSV